MLLRTIPALVASLAVVASASASGAPTPARDSFHGRITGATGKLRPDRDRIAIKLQRDATNPQAVTLTLTGRRCHGAKNCVRLVGKLTGTMTQETSIPDAGTKFAISASGRVKPLGRMSASGTAHGTGFIAYGYESLHLTLRRASGSVTIDARSGRVPGFTSP